jgi:hypothetical protein
MDRTCPFAVLLALLVSFNPLLAAEDDAAKSKPADPTGTWKWQRTFNDNDVEFTLQLNWDGKELTGKYSAFDNTSDIERAKFEKDQISFVAQREFNGNEFEVKFDGKVEPDDINGKISLDFGDAPQEFDWSAKRSVEPDDVVGIWDLKVESPDGGVIEPQVTITKAKDDKLEGRSVSQFGEFDLSNVAVKDNMLSWEISREQDGRSFKVVYKGKPRGNTIEGEAEVDFDGDKATMEFTGKRTPAEEKKDAKPADSQDDKAEAADSATTPSDSTSDTEP